MEHSYWVDIYLQKNKRMVWNNRIGWKKSQNSQKLIKVWGGIIVLGGRFLECYFWPGEKMF